MVSNPEWFPGSPAKACVPQGMGFDYSAHRAVKVGEYMDIEQY